MLSDDDSSKNSIDTLRSAIFESSGALSSQKKKIKKQRQKVSLPLHSSANSSHPPPPPPHYQSQENRPGYYSQDSLLNPHDHYSHNPYHHDSHQHMTTNNITSNINSSNPSRAPRISLEHHDDHYESSLRWKENNRHEDNRMNTKNTVLESELIGSRLSEEIRKLRSELSHCQQQKHESVMLLQKTQQDNESYRIRNKELEWTVEKLEREKQVDDGKRESKLLSYESEKEKYLSDNNNLRDQVLSLKEKLSDADELGLRLARSLEAARNEIDQIRRKEAQYQEGYHNNFLTTLKQKDADVNALTRAVQDLRIEKSNLENELQRRKQLDHERESIKSHYDAIDRSRSELGDEKVNALQRQVKALTDQRSYLTKEKGDLEDQCLELRKENGKYESRIYELRQKQQSQAQSLSDMQAQHSEEIQSYNTKNRELSMQLKSSKNTIEELTSINKSQDSIIHKIRVELSVLQEKYSTLKRLNMQLLSATSTYENILEHTEKL